MNTKYGEKSIKVIKNIFANVHLLLKTNLRAGNSKMTIFFLGFKVLRTFQHFCTVCKKLKSAQLMAQQKSTFL